MDPPYGPPLCTPPLDPPMEIVSSDPPYGPPPRAPTYNLRINLPEFSINLPEEVACAALSLRLAADGIVQSVTLNARPIPLPSAPNASYSIALEANAGFGGFLLGNNILDVVLHSTSSVVGFYAAGSVQVGSHFLRAAAGLPSAVACPMPRACPLCRIRSTSRP